MTDHRRVGTNSPWEQTYGYSRAVRAGHLVVTTGTVALDADGSPHAPGDAFAQAARCYEIIERALAELGAAKADIVRTRMFVTDIARADAFGRAHKAFFANSHPCLTMVEIARLIAPEFLIEIEAEAVIDDG